MIAIVVHAATSVVAQRTRMAIMDAGNPVTRPAPANTRDLR
jgi:hypothetical protein